MKRLLSIVCWTLVALLLLVGMDQFFRRVPLETPVLTEVRTFYLDFSDRLLAQGGEDVVEKAIEQAERHAPAAPSAAAATKPPASPGFVYVDDKGVLQMADSLSEVPARFRKEAQPMK